MPKLILSSLLLDIKLEFQETDFSKSIALGVSESKTDTKYSFSALSFKDNIENVFFLSCSKTGKCN